MMSEVKQSIATRVEAFRMRGTVKTLIEQYRDKTRPAPLIWQTAKRGDVTLMSERIFGVTYSVFHDGQEVVLSVFKRPRTIEKHVVRPATIVDLHQLKEQIQKF